MSSFIKQHLGISPTELQEMLDFVEVRSLKDLIQKVAPSEILLQKEISLPEGLDEYQYLTKLKDIISKNQVFKSYIGLGYYPTITPSVIRRNIFENPGWYTPYTAYQAEVSQGRLEALFNFQTMITDMTGFEISNCSLLDEATAAAEAMVLFFRVRDVSKQEANFFFISKNVLPQTIDVIFSRAEPLGVQVTVDDTDNFLANAELSSYFGALIQYPDQDGKLVDIEPSIQMLNKKGVRSALACDLLALALIKSPAELGAHIAIGSSQRFGISMGYGGPHAAFFACKEEYKRQVPGRIIGVSKTVHGEMSYRMALQTREQHIRREKATSNICTAQALLASIAGMYAVYHGARGIKEIAERINQQTCILYKNLKEMGYSLSHTHFFDTLKIDLHKNKSLKDQIQALAISAKINFRYFENLSIGISLNETSTQEDIEEISYIFMKAKGLEIDLNLLLSTIKIDSVPNFLKRKSPYLQHSVFKKYHSETLLMRYMKLLENKDISLTTSMIPLGSCTMKLNSAVEMTPMSWEKVSDIHPFVPKDQVSGYSIIVQELESFLKEITGLFAVSFQPNSGAQGEYTGLMIIRAYHEDQGEGFRNVALIPTSAHGTNPASAVMAGMQVVLIQCDKKGNIDINDLLLQVKKYSETLAVLMVTYPSTHGIFEENIKKVCDIIHNNNGFVYMDGANMNAQVGITHPAFLGADVCHLNLHKTFAIPHGGGGPGMGPIVVTKKLACYLPSHIFIKNKKPKAIKAVSAAHLSSASILLISHAYISLMGKLGLRLASEYAILNANYIKKRLEKDYTILFVNIRGFVAHELIIDLREFKKSVQLEAEDIAKRLIDYGFHAPTLSWPIVGTMMIEPTESESKTEIDRFCDALISIRNEITKIEIGEYNREDNPIKNAPHTHQHLITDEWSHSYSREEAAYPLEYLKKNKYWSPVSRIDNTYGDRNLICSCTSLENYQFTSA